MTALDPRTKTLIEAPIAPTLLRLAVPNVITTLVQASTGLIETYFIGKLGTDALAGVALVFPGVMLMQMMSAGAMGGGVSSAIARALGAGRREDADATILHALVIAAGFALFFTVAMHRRRAVALCRARRPRRARSPSALTYSNIVFAGVILIWLFNTLANVIRGTGNTFVPAVVTLAGAALLVPLSAALIFGFGPLPRAGRGRRRDRAADLLRPRRAGLRRSICGRAAAWCARSCWRRGCAGRCSATSCGSACSPR